MNATAVDTLRPIRAPFLTCRRCPCGREFETFNQMSSHIRNVHCKPTAMQREGAAIGDALFRM